VGLASHSELGCGEPLSTRSLRIGKNSQNVVESLEEEGALGNLDDTEVFMFTDNSTVESCAARGHPRQESYSV
jgi:hypothetical protein